MRGLQRLNTHLICFRLTAGKSTLLNRILDWQKGENAEYIKHRAGNQNARKGSVTTSPLPGTTLKFIEVDLGDGQKLIDTPGLLVDGTLTQLLTPAELKIVVPQKYVMFFETVQRLSKCSTHSVCFRKIEPITFRVASGKCVLIGGLARIEVMGETKPFLLTFFVANQIKLHPTDSSRADDFVRAHAGAMLTPPLPPGPERMADLGEFEEHVLTIEGVGWKEAAADISLTGLGWIAVTGAGKATVKVSVPNGIGVSVRPPLMPYDIWESAASYTGSRAVRKISRRTGGKRRKGVGRN
jgi:30S ribosome assembly GTPase